MSIILDNISRIFQLNDKTYNTVISNLSIHIQEGSIVVILGQSGCGKSTLLNMISGILNPSCGEIRIHDKKVISPNPNIAYLFQTPTLLPWLSIAENIAFGCRIRKDNVKLSERVKYYIDLMGLSGFGHYHPREISSDMASRVCLARALIAHPYVLLLDEPFSSLDTISKEKLYSILIQIWKQKKFTILLVTHDIDEAIQLGTRVMLLGGKPSNIKHDININEAYPRSITNENMIHLRKQIYDQYHSVFQWNYDVIP